MRLLPADRRLSLGLASAVTVTAACLGTTSARTALRALALAWWGEGHAWSGVVMGTALTLWVVLVAMGFTVWALKRPAWRRKWGLWVTALALAGGLLPGPETAGLQQMTVACDGGDCIVAARFQSRWVGLPADWQIGTPVTLWTSPLLGVVCLQYQARRPKPPARPVPV